MKVHRRRKSSRYRGSHTHGRGFKKKARGSGHRGGFGMAGTGKRGDQKKTLILNLYGNDYFGKSRTLRRGTPRRKVPEMNLGMIQLNLHSFIKQGIAQDKKSHYELNLSRYKILGEGEISSKLIIKALAASKSAVDKVKKAGGEIILPQSADK